MLNTVFNKQVFRPGETIKAYITLNIPDRIEVEYGQLELKYVFRSREVDGGFKKIYIDESLGFMKPGPYNPGVYSYNVTYTIPSNVPPSFRGRILEGVLRYECIVKARGGFSLRRTGELIITKGYESPSQETLYSISSGDIHLTLLLDRPVKGRILRGVLTIEEGRELVRRIFLDLCIYEGYRVQKLLFLRNFRETSRCITIHSIGVDRRGMGSYPFRADLSRMLGGRAIYTAPYADGDIRFQTYLRLRMITRDGMRTYYQPIEWYPYEESEDTQVETEVLTMEERIRRAIIEFFEVNLEGDIIDIQEYLEVKGFSVNIHMLERMIRGLIEEGVLQEADNNPILKKYRLRG